MNKSKIFRTLMMSNKIFMKCLDKYPKVGILVRCESNKSRHITREMLAGL